MKNYFQHILFLLILMPLCLNGHSSFIGSRELVFWEATGQVKFQLGLAEEEELDSKEHAENSETCKIDKGGDGGKEAIEAAEAKTALQAPALQVLRFFTLAIREHRTLNAAQIAAITGELLNKPRIRLFLLFLNLKSDLSRLSA